MQWNCSNIKPVWLIILCRFSFLCLDTQRLWLPSNNNSPMIPLFIPYSAHRTICHTCPYILPPSLNSAFSQLLLCYGIQKYYIRSIIPRTLGEKRNRKLLRRSGWIFCYLAQKLLKISQKAHIILLVGRDFSWVCQNMIAKNTIE